MKILIIGNRSHQFICNYVRFLRNAFERLSYPITIDILSQEVKGETFPSDYLYNSIYSLRMNPIFYKSRLIRGGVKQIKFRQQLQKLTNYDIVHIHYIEDILIRDASFFSKNVKGRLIATIWGSDFLRATTQQKKQMTPILDRADKITIASQEVIDDFNNHYKSKNYDSKVAQCYFGLQPLENLKNIIESNINQSTSKKTLGLSDKKIITIGYNATKNQRHIEIVKSIESNTDLLKFKNEIQFVLPMTYPKDDLYVEEINTLVKQSPFQHTIIRNFLDDDKVAHLRNATDIFIQLQPTDMLSGSTIEHLAAGNIVTTGSWLPYRCLKEWGVYVREINNVMSVSKELFDILNNENDIKSNCKNNFSILAEKFLWKNVINDWLKVYDYGRN